MIEQLVADGLWERVAGLLPPSKPRRHLYPRRRPIDDRAGRHLPTAATNTTVAAASSASAELPRGRPALARATAPPGVRRWVAERGFAWLHAV